MKNMNKLLRFHLMPFHVKLMYPEAFLLSAYYRFRILHTPFFGIAAQMGTQGQETGHEHIASAIPHEIANVIDGVCKHTPWESKCLVRALTAMNMLKRRGFHCTLYMGVQMNDGKMGAHAWLRCGRLYVTGGNGAGYTVTTIYGDHARYHNGDNQNG